MTENSRSTVDEAEVAQFSRLGAERQGLRKYDWLIVVAAMVVVYVWKPYWPHSIRSIPGWPWMAVFVVVVSAIAIWAGRRRTVASLCLGAILVALYFYGEYLGAAFVFDAQDGHLADRFLQKLDTYLIVAFANVVFNGSVVVTFVVLQAILLTVGRTRTFA